MKEEIIKWIQSGANLNDGIQLFSIYGNNPHFLRIVQLNPEGNRDMLNYQLCQLAGITEAEFTKLLNTASVQNKRSVDDGSAKNCKVKTIRKPTSTAQSTAQPKFRERYSFLNDKNCPYELKVLAADKITAWHNYTELHKKLFSVTNNDEALKIARELVENYKENRLIHEELDYYAKHKHILGKHRIFARLEKFKHLQKLNILELYQKKKRLEHNIWRLKSEIKKGNKPELYLKRMTAIDEKKSELAEINKLING